MVHLNIMTSKENFTKVWSETVNSIKGFNKPPYEFLSNMIYAPIQWNQYKVSCSEVLYQMMKSNDEYIREQIMSKNGYESKRYWKINAHNIRPDWDSIKYKVMKNVLKLKFDQNLNLKQLLIETNNAYIEESNYWHDNFFGVCYCNKGCKGKSKFNYLGLLLMELRGYYLDLNEYSIDETIFEIKEINNGLF